MAVTSYGVNHPLAVKLWSRKLFHEIFGLSYFAKFVGTSDSSLIQIKTETQKSEGDKVTFGLRMLATGDGIQGDSTLEGNEEALTTYSDAVVLDQLRHAFRSGGRMSEQRVPFSVREEIRMAAQDWWVERMEYTIANQLAGNSSQADTRYTGNQVAIAPNSNRLLIAGPNSDTTEASLSATTTYAIKLADLDRAVAKAKVAVSGVPRIRPVNVDGKNMYVCLMHPYAIYQLRRDASTAGNFFDIQKAQLQGGKISDNPILTGAEFIYNNVIVHEWDYLPTVASSVTSSTLYRRAVFCGAQAAVLAFGQNNSENKMTWAEEVFDYGNQLGVSAGMIFGCKKTVFNSIDFGVITLSGYAPAP